MAGKNRNKEKGKGFERDICKIMSKYFGGSWIRTWGSGNYVGGKNVDRMNKLSDSQIHNNRSDITPPDEFNLAIECKAYKDFPFNTLLADGNAIMDKWIGQIETDIQGEEFYMIVFKINSKGIYIVVNTKFLKSGLKTSKNFSMYKFEGKTYLITAFEPFIAENVEIIRQLSK